MATKDRLDKAIRECPADPGTTVYFLRLDKKHFKIGFTTRQGLTRRFEGKLFNAGECKIICEIPGSQSLERLLHARFSHLWVERESFKITPEVWGYIRKLKRWRNAK